MAVLLGRPAVDEKPGWDEEAGCKEERDAVLRLSDTVVLFLENAVDSVVERGGYLRSQSEAQAERDVVETADADRFMVVFRIGPQLREGGEHEIHQAVDVGHVACQSLDDGLCRKQTEGPNEGHPEQFDERFVGALLRRLVVRVSGGFAQFLGLRLQDYRGIGLAEEEEAQNLDGTVDDGGCVEYPAPGRVLGDETTSYRTYRGTKQRCKTVH